MENVETMYHPYIVYDEDWVCNAIDFFRTYKNYIDGIEDFRPTTNNEYSVMIRNYGVSFISENIYSELLDWEIRLKSKKKKYESEADEIILIFAYFDKSEKLKNMVYIYPDGTKLIISFELYVLDKNNSLISTRPSIAEFVDCKHMYPVAVTVKDYLKR